MSNNASILVTGGAGFIGSNFVHHVVDEFDTVYVIDKLTYAGNLNNLDGVQDSIEFTEGTIRDRHLLSRQYESVDYVVNFAAESHVDRSIEAAAKFVQSNVEGAYTAMDLLREHDIENFLHMSTDEVYGSREKGAFREDDPLDPSSPYAATKASADLLINSLWETYELPITVVRPTNTFGPRQHPEKLIPKFTLRAMENRSLPLYGDGSNVRQWLYVQDLCEALETLSMDGDNDIYNVSGRAEKTNLEVAHAILERLGKSRDLIEFVSNRKGHDYRYSVSDKKVRSEFDFESNTGFDEGLDRTVSWYQQQVDTFDTV